MAHVVLCQDKEKAKAAAKLGSLGLTVIAQEEDAGDGTEFTGGLSRLEAKLKLRDLALAAAGVADLKVLSMYTTELFDRAYEKPLCKNYRPPTVPEVIAADKQAWQEALRLVAAGSGDLNACLVHVSKAGGLVSTLLRPMPGDTKPPPAVSFHLYVCVCSLVSDCPIPFVQVAPGKDSSGWKDWKAKGKKDDWKDASWKRGRTI